MESDWTKPFATLEALELNCHRAVARDGDRLQASDDVMTLVVRFPGGKPFQIVLGETGRTELERVLFPGDDEAVGA